MANTSTSNVLTSGALDEYIRKMAIHSYQETREFCRFAKKVSLPKGQHTYAFPVTTKMTGSATTLTEWITPTNKNITRTKVPVTLLQYGDYIPLTDIVLDDNSFDLIDESVYELSNMVSRTVDNAAQDVLDAGTNVEYKGQTVRTAITATNLLTANDLANAFRVLEGASAPKFDGKNYVCIMHTDVYHDLNISESTTWFISVLKYSKPEMIMEWEVGMMHGIRIIRSNNVQRYVDGGAGNVDVYPTFFFGKNAFGEVTSGGLESIYKGMWSGGTDDPLNQRATVSAKTRVWFAILKEEGLFRIETAASKGDNS